MNLYRLSKIQVCVPHISPHLDPPSKLFPHVTECHIFATLICRLPDAIKAELERLPRPVEYGGDYFAVPYAIELRIGAVITAKVFSGGR